MRRPSSQARHSRSRCRASAVAPSRRGPASSMGAGRAGAEAARAARSTLTTRRASRADLLREAGQETATGGVLPVIPARTSASSRSSRDAFAGGGDRPRARARAPRRATSVEDDCRRPRERARRPRRAPVRSRAPRCLGPWAWRARAGGRGTPLASATACGCVGMGVGSWADAEPADARPRRASRHDERSGTRDPGHQGRANVSRRAVASTLSHVRTLRELLEEAQDPRLDRCALGEHLLQVRLRVHAGEPEEQDEGRHRDAGDRERTPPRHGARRRDRGSTPRARALSTSAAAVCSPAARDVRMPMSAMTRNAAAAATINATR